MSDIEKNQPSEFNVGEEIETNLRKRKHSGNTSVDSMMHDTPANYNL